MWVLSTLWCVVTPDLPVGAHQGTGDAPGKSAVKRTGGKQLYFFLNSAASQHFSSRPAPGGAADVIETEDATELDNSLWRAEWVRKVPTFSVLAILFLMQVFSKAHPSVVGKILASSCLLNPAVQSIGIWPVLLLGSVVLLSWGWFNPLLVGA